MEGPAAALGAGPPAEATGALVGWDRFDSIATPGKGLALSFWRTPQSVPGASAPVPGRIRVVRIVRDYGMFDRTEAPQYHPPAPSPGIANSCENRVGPAG